MAITQSSLVHEALEDRHAFAALYQQWVKPVYRYLYSKVRDVHTAEDLTSQTFITVLQSLHTLRDPQRFPSWLFTIARNKAMDHFRKTRYDVPADDEWIWPKAQVESESNHAEPEDRILVRQELTRLTEPELELVRLQYVADLTFIEIARVLSRPESTVKKTLYRLLARVQRQLEQENGN